MQFLLVVTVCVSVCERDNLRAQRRNLMNLGIPVLEWNISDEFDCG